MKKYFIKKAETILEIIMSIFIISLGATVSLTVLSIAVTGNESLGKRVEAINLAREALEVFIKQRDANVQSAEYVSNPDCWRAINVSNCIGDGLWSEGSDYILVFNSESQTWQILDADMTMDKPPDDKFLIYQNNDGFYTQNTPANEKTIFYRAVKVDLLNPDDLSLEFTEGEAIKLTVTVYFQVKNHLSQVKLSTVLTNHN